MAGGGGEIGDAELGPVIDKDGVAEGDPDDDMLDPEEETAEVELGDRQ